MDIYLVNDIINTSIKKIYTQGGENMNEKKSFILKKSVRNSVVSSIILQVILLVIISVLCFVFVPLLAIVGVIADIIMLISIIMLVATSGFAKKAVINIDENGINGIRPGIFKNINFKYSYAELEYVKLILLGKDNCLCVKAKNEEKEWRMNLEGSEEAVELCNKYLQSNVAE